MKISKYIFVFSLCIVFLFSNVIPASAAQVNEFLSINFDVNGVGRYYENGTTINVDYTDNITVSSSTYLSEACTVYSIPIDSDYTFRFVSGFQLTNLNASHEYNLSFKYNIGLPDTTLFGVYLCFYDSSGSVLREQALFEPSSNSSGWNDVNINFMPDTSGLGGYNTKLEFRFFCTSSSAVNFRLSEKVVLTDKNDMSELLESILAAINNLDNTVENSSSSLLNQLFLLDSHIDSYISALESNLITQLVTLDNHIDSYFDELGGDLLNAITTLDSHIDGYFDLLLNGIITNDNALSDKLHSYLEKYKPRVYEDLRWENSLVNNVSGDVISIPPAVVKRRACTSDLFYVPAGSVYNLDVVIPSDLINWVNIYQYTSSGEYISYSSASEGITVLEQGYSYRFQIMFVDAVDGYSISELSDICNSYVKLYADEGWLNAFGSYILNGFDKILNPGVYEDPGEDAFQENKDQWEQTEGNLPTLDDGAIHDVDISDYSGGFGVVRYMFERFVNVSGFTPLLSFSLMFGLGVFLIGRKVGG